MWRKTLKKELEKLPEKIIYKEKIFWLRIEKYKGIWELSYRIFGEDIHCGIFKSFSLLKTTEKFFNCKRLQKS